jgi:hypothetical protein
VYTEININTSVASHPTTSWRLIAAFVGARRLSAMQTLILYIAMAATKEFAAQLVDQAKDSDDAMDSNEVLSAEEEPKAASTRTRSARTTTLPKKSSAEAVTDAQERGLPAPDGPKYTGPSISHRVNTT